MLKLYAFIISVDSSVLLYTLQTVERERERELGMGVGWGERETNWGEGCTEGETITILEQGCG